MLSVASCVVIRDHFLIFADMGEVCSHLMEELERVINVCSNGINNVGDGRGRGLLAQLSEFSCSYLNIIAGA